MHPHNLANLKSYKGHINILKLSRQIPAKDEKCNIDTTIRHINKILLNNKIEHEIILINDQSRYSTLKILNKKE